MKSIKFLAALALPAIFAACTNEELAVVQEDFQSKSEFVGAELIGTNVSMNFGSQSESRLSSAGWEAADKLGLAWVVSDNFIADQTADVNPTDPKLYANHMFQKDGDKGFTTKGNLYKGWHFAYYPFTYMEKLGVEKTVEINPVQTQNFVEDRYDNCLYLSAREFLSKDNLDENYQLGGVVYDMFRAFNTIAITVEPSVTFTESNALQNLAIQSIKTNAGAGVFTVGSVELDPTKLAAIQYDEDGEYDKEATKVALFNSFGTALKAKSSIKTSITTEVKNKDINLSGNQTLRIFAMPRKATLDPRNVHFTINVEGGVFAFGYTDKPEKDLKDYEKYNNEAIQALVKAYKEGAMSQYNKNNGVVAINLKLTKKMFDEDFSSISNLEEWNQAVKVADALDIVGNFNVDGEVCIDGSVNLDIPAKGVNVTTQGEGVICVESEYVIPAALAKALDANDKVVVKKEGTLVVEDNIVVKADITNEGTIKLGYKAKVDNVNNKEGRIDVIYGSYVTVKSGTEAGVIAYEITGEETAKEINDLTSSSNQLGNVYVNTLVVSGLEFDLSMGDDVNVNDNPYNGENTGGDALQRMADINFELNNGVLSANVNTSAKVKNVEVIGGENNEIWNIDITEKLTVTAGKVTVDAEVLNNYKNNITAEEISVKSGAELTTNANIYVKNISNPTGAKTTVNTSWTIWYTDVYTQGGTATGNILKASWDGVADQPAYDATTKTYTINTADELVWLAQQDKVNSSKIVLDGNINMAGVNWTKGIHAGDGDYETHIDGKGYSILNLNGTSGLFEYSVGTIKNLTIDGAVIGNVDFAGVLANNAYSSIENVTIKNVSVQGTKHVGAVVGIHNGGMIKNCVVENAAVSGNCYSAGVISGFVNETVKNRIYENCTIKNSNVNTTTKGAITGAINGLTLTIKNIKVIGTTPTSYVGEFYNGGTLVESK